MLKEIAKFLSNGRKIILVHGDADMDAVGSAYAISKIFPEADICAPNGIDRTVKIVSEKIKLEILKRCDISSYDTVVVVDTSSPEQLGPCIELPYDKTIIIDHHQNNEKFRLYNTYVDSSKIACTEIILDIIKENGISVTKDVGLMLLGGMLTDSGHFQFANSTLLKNFAYILDNTGIQMDEVMALIKLETDISERVATIKHIGRSKFDYVDNMIVATSHGGSFEASGCRALMFSGADVAFVASQRGDNFRLSARTTQEMIRNGLNLSKMLKDLSFETATDGGGHEGAAGLSGVGDAESILHICMMKTMEEFRKIKKMGRSPK
ncbi:MAG: DHH family phosphoesterase [archaeon]|nr:DHH family phosphoesterase [archaeon]